MPVSAENTFLYNIPWKSTGAHLGDHRGTQRGLGFEYRGNISLLDYPDARRMDVARSITDPYEQVQVRLFSQDSTTPIHVVCDISSSMQHKSRHRKLDKAIEIAAAAAHSAYDMGDVFSFIAYNDKVLEEFTLAPSHHLPVYMETLHALKQYQSFGKDSNGVLEVAQYVGQGKSLIFWISDFHMPLDVISQVMNSFSGHQVVPIILWDDNEYKRLPKFGFGNLIDPESGLSRTVFFRQSLTVKVMNAFAERRHALESLFMGFDTPPLFIHTEFKPDMVTRYFEQHMSL